MVQVYAMGHISGAHFNPAVSLAVCISGGIPISRLLAYWAVQLPGGIVGAFAAFSMAGPTDIQPFVPNPALSHPVLAALFAEMVFTFALAMVVMSVGGAYSTSPNSYFAMAIGFTLLAGAASVGSVSGSVLNPAVGTAIDLASLTLGTPPSSNSYTWVYWVGPCTGATLAAVVYNLLNKAVESEKRELADALDEEVQSSKLPVRVVVFEFIGTFYLTFTASMSSMPLAVGAILTAMVFASSGFSGGDFNPAVTFGAVLRGGVLMREAWKLLVIALTQVSAAIVAGFVSYAIGGRVGWPHPDGPESTLGAFGFELVWTTLLVFVVLCTTTQTLKPTLPHVREAYKARDSTHGLAIGMTVAVGAINAGMHGAGSGGVFNPAVGTGLSIAALAMEQDPASALWIFWLAPAIAAPVAVLLFKLLHTHADALLYTEEHIAHSDGGGGIVLPTTLDDWPSSAGESLNGHFDDEGVSAK
jgi:aquaporin Z